MRASFMIVCVIFIGSQNISFADITFTEGKWETTFDCAEQTVINSINCDGLKIYLEQKASDPSEHSAVEAAANNPAGSGNGFSRINGWGNAGYGNGVGDNSESIYVNFPTPEKEVWIRTYIRYPSNWAASPFIADKYIFVRAEGNKVQAILEPDPTGFRMLCQGLTTSVGDNAQSTFKVSDMFTTGKYVGDDEWHCIEIHIKMDTNGIYGGAKADGIAQVWIDGVLKIDSTTVNYSKGDVTTKTGWSDFNINLNQNKLLPVDANLARVFVDDIVVYNTTPPKKDVLGNPFIGPIWVRDFKHEN